MKTTCRANKKVWLSIFILISGLSGSGCNNYLVFTTSTKFGIDISQDAGQPPKMALGYKRAEIALIPSDHTPATPDTDTYAVLSDFCVMANPSLYDWTDTVTKSKSSSTEVKDSLQIRSIFATGMAAREAAKTEAIQTHFAQAALRRTHAGVTEKHCF
ncbi:MAG: hypothetical protein HOP35_11210 [Nitrospira sp.]|nr:hypothetical protein [Nitrospira sp.]